MSSPIFNGTNGEAHKTQHITARKVVEVNSFFIPQQLTRTNVRKEEHTPCTGEAFFLPHRHRKTRSASPARGKQSGPSKRGGEPGRPALPLPVNSHPGRSEHYILLSYSRKTLYMIVVLQSHQQTYKLYKPDLDNLHDYIR